jgi:hypothetical protein
LNIGMRVSTGTPFHDPSGARKFQRPTRRERHEGDAASREPHAGPSFPSGVSRKSPAYSLPGSPPTTTSLRPACSRGVSGVRITTTCVKSWPNELKSMYSTRFVYVVVAGNSSPAAMAASASIGTVSRSAGSAASRTAKRISFIWNGKWCQARMFAIIVAVPAVVPRRPK